MRIVLRLSGDAEAEGGALKTVTLTDRDIFVGRDSSCDWAVADALGMMSRRHCSLRAQGDQVLLTDLSSNGTSLGSPGNRLVQGQPTPLPDTAVIFLGGDHIRVDYECHREEKAADTPAQDDDFWGVNEIKRNRGQGRKPTYDDLNLLVDDDPDRNNPLALTLDAADDRQPLGDVLSLDDDPAPRATAPTPQAAPDRVTFETPMAAATPSADDLFAVDGGDADPFADLGGGTASAPDMDTLTLDDPVPPQPAATPLVDPLSLDDSTPPQSNPAPVDTLSLDDSVPQTAPVAVAPAATPHPQTIPPITPQTQAPATPPPQAAAPTQSGQADRTLAALFATLGIPVDEIPPEKQHEMAAEIGRSFRALADGLRELLASRRDVKIALGLGATQIETGSNPLKFARDANAAVDSLLRPSASGFLTGSTAVHDAVTALQQHQVALVGGVKASMKTALEAFDPTEIEKKLTRKGLSTVIPMKRKAELWEQFVANYKDFATEADEDIRRVIGKQLEQLYADEATRSRAALDL